MKVLIRFPHGLGDCVQFSVILAHLRKHRKDWTVDVRVGRGKHTALEGLCNRVYHDQEPEPTGPYNSVSELGWYENYCAYGDRPNSKITNCLHECFGLDYDRTLERYQMKLGPGPKSTAHRYLTEIGCKETDGRFNAVILHYQGNTSSGKKNLHHWQAKLLTDFVLQSGRVPVILDWDGRSTLPDNSRIFCPRTGDGDIWGSFGSGDAAVIAALVGYAEAFVGIDSGPGKCASCTETPALVCWKELHPIQFHDPAPNTVHLIPQDWHRIPPCDKQGPAAYFQDHYKFETYRGERGLVTQAKQWLSRVLNHPILESEMTVPFVLPNGIGDVTWALLKIKSIAGDKPIDIMLAGDPGREIDRRAIPFVKRFPFVRSCEVLDLEHLKGKDEYANDAQGRYRYVDDGLQDGFHFLMPNGPLERGKRLEEWLPEHAIDWNLFDKFDWSNTERGEQLGTSLDPFVSFYLGPEAGNVDEGHNKGFLWEPKHWNALGKTLTGWGMNIVLVGADYDRSYWDRYVKEGVGQEGMHWYDLIGKLEIGETLALLRKCKFFVSYQCGLAIVLHYLGGRVVSWWRPAGDSAHPKRLVSFDENMRYGWNNPALADNYIGCLYKQESVMDILSEVDRRGWLR